VITEFGGLGELAQPLLQLGADLGQVGIRRVGAPRQPIGGGAVGGEDILAPRLDARQARVPGLDVGAHLGHAPDASAELRRPGAGEQHSGHGQQHRHQPRLPSGEIAPHGAGTPLFVIAGSSGGRRAAGSS
jgi:hypothetical protein